MNMVGLVFGIAGGGIVAWGALGALRTQSFLRRAVTAEGTIVGNEQSWSSDSDGSGSHMSYRPVVEFATADGKQVTFEEGMGTSWQSYSAGDTVAVKYDASDPEHATIDSWFRKWGLHAFLLGFGGIFLVIGLALLAA